LSRSCDHVGTLTRSASDIAFVMAALSTQPSLAKAFQRLALNEDRPGLKGRTVGVLDTFTTDLPGVDPAFGKALDTLIAGLILAGAVVKQIKAPPLAQLAACAKSIVYGEAYGYHGQEIDDTPSLFGQRTRDRIGQGRGLLARDYRLHSRPYRAATLDSAVDGSGISDDGLPVGLSVSAAMGHDANLVPALIAVETEGLSGFRVPSFVR
jgi:Asp-tRNA(Asn)/Glu-tRNA(Gln) amidotransferase A subunit family amidase